MCIPFGKRGKILKVISGSGTSPKEVTWQNPTAAQEAHLCNQGKDAHRPSARDSVRTAVPHHSSNEDHTEPGNDGAAAAPHRQSMRPCGCWGRSLPPSPSLAPLAPYVHVHLFILPIPMKIKRNFS